MHILTKSQPYEYNPQAMNAEARPPSPLVEPFDMVLSSIESARKMVSKTEARAFNTIVNVLAKIYDIQNPDGFCRLSLSRGDLLKVSHRVVGSTEATFAVEEWQNPQVETAGVIKFYKSKTSYLPDRNLIIQYTRTKDDQELDGFFVSLRDDKENATNPRIVVNFNYEPRYIKADDGIMYPLENKKGIEFVGSLNNESVFTKLQFVVELLRTAMQLRLIPKR